MLRQEVITLVFIFMEALAIVHPVTNQPIGTLPRAQAIREGAWCRSTNIYVINSKGEILCHQRSLQKERFPGIWMTHLGGHVGSDETYDSNALKELAEESGISVEPSQLIPWRTSKKEDARLWIRDYVVMVDKEIHQLIPQPGEVERFAWMSVADILKDSQNRPDMWKAGTHDFLVEYHCLRTALAVACSRGAVTSDAIDLHTWQPVAA